MRFRVGVNAAAITKRGKELFVLGEARATLGKVKASDKIEKKNNIKKMKGEDDLII